MSFCQCEYCEQRRKREPETDLAWLLSVAALVLALAVGGVCVAFLVQPR